jgi:hypothetical protein
MPPVTAELVVAKQELEKEREEKQKMAGCIQSLQEELSHAMSELKRLKARDDEEAAATAATAKVIDLEIDEGLSFTEPEKKLAPPRSSADDGVAASAAGGEFQKKRYVTFADPPTATTCRAPPLPDVVMELHRAPSQPHPQPHYYREPRFQRQMSAGHEAAKAMAAEEGRKKKKKPLIPLVGALFMRRKKNSSSCHDDSF